MIESQNRDDDQQFDQRESGPSEFALVWLHVLMSVMMSVMMVQFPSVGLVPGTERP